MTDTNKVLKTELEFEQRRADQLQRQLAELQKHVDEFTYIVSHDLHAPIRAISSLTSWLEADHSQQLNDEGRELMQLLTKQSQTLGQMVDAIRNYSRIGRIRESYQKTDLLQLIPSIYDNLVSDGISTINISSSLPTIIGEPLRIEQLFTYLLENAVQHHRSELGAIEVQGTDSRDYWEITITDRGLGIPLKYHDEIFSIFRHLSTNSQNKPLGVGLTLSKKIVESHGGSINIISEDGVGTTIVVNWPKDIPNTSSSSPLTLTE
jgi:two-component system, LuxR family, sensor kinase FixL